MTGSKMTIGARICFGVASIAMLANCETASELGDDALRMGSFGRIQATPFTNSLDTKSCREALTTALGFARETRIMKQGVFVVQSFDCKADRVVAEVSLTNHTADPMFCFAETEETVTGVELAPNGVGFFEYSYAEHAEQDCILSS